MAGGELPDRGLELRQVVAQLEGHHRRTSGGGRRGVAAVDLGVNKDLVMRWMAVLRIGGYIAARSTGRCLYIRVNKWKTLGEYGKTHTQNRGIPHLRVCRNPTSQKPGDSQNEAIISQEIRASPSPIDIAIKRNIFINDNDTNFSMTNINGFKHKNKNELLANEIAEALNDLAGLPLYRSFANKYPTELLRGILEEVIAIPAHKIKKSKGALFNYLVQKYASKADNNSWD